MKILYLTEDFFASKVHYNLLINELQQKVDLEVFVFSPLRDANRKDLSVSYLAHKRLHIVSPQIDINKLWYRFWFSAKLRCKLRLIEQTIPVSELDGIHASTLYSEGGVAFLLHKKYGLPYLVSLRGSDVHMYSKVMFHLWPLGNHIIRQANSITSVTSAIKNRLVRMIQYYPNKKRLEDCAVINNGIDKVWLDNLNVTSKKIGECIKVLFIGRFDDNKNILRLIESVRSLRKEFDLKLLMIGGHGRHHENVLKLVGENDYLEYLGEIYDKDRLRDIIRGCDIYAMCSHSETFGLVYAECLSQGLPILYSRGTGFDGLYPNGHVGFGVDSSSTKDISKGIKEIILHYDDLRDNISRLDFHRYDWPNIAKRFLTIINQNVIRSSFKESEESIEEVLL